MVKPTLKRLRSVALRVVVEIVVLAGMGAAWAWFRVPNHAPWTIGDGVEDAFKAFFFVGYFYSYFMRATKSADDKSRHGDIIAQQEKLLMELNSATERLVGHASGGDSFGWLMMTHVRDGAFRDITAHVQGQYPLVDARATVADLDKNLDAFEEVRRTGDVHLMFKHHVRFSLGTLQPTIATLQHQTVPCDLTRPLMRFRVEWVARNGTWSQVIQLKWNGQRWDFATAVQRGEAWVFENPERGQLPKRPDGTPDVFWLPANEPEAAPEAVSRPAES